MTIYVTQPITNSRILPGSVLSNDLISDRIVIGGCPGEYLTACFTIKEAAQITNLLPIASDIGVIPAANVDIRWVKCWLQAPNSLEVYTGLGHPHCAGVYVYEYRMDLMPELLLHDNSLVEISVSNPSNPTDIPTGEPENWVKMLDGSYMLVGISPLPYPSRNQQMPIDIFSPNDSITIQPTNIPANTNQQVWLTIKVPDDAAPGMYTGSISLESESGNLGNIDITLEVYPFTLDEPFIEPSIYHNEAFEWTYPEPRIGCWRSPAQLMVGYLNLKEHGITNPVLFEGWVSQFETARVHYLREHLAIRQQAGMVMNPIYWAAGAWSQGPPINTLYRDPVEHRAELQFIKDLFAEYGCTDLYLYGDDEEGVNDYEREQIATAHSMGLKVMNASTQDELMQGEFDLVNQLGWQANWSFNHDPDPAIAAYWHARGAKVFSYSNPQGGPELPLTWRKNFGLLIWKGDYDGGMPYGWHGVMGAGGWDEMVALDPDRPYRPYGMKQHNMVYPTVDSVIDTLQWEGYREGINDTRYLNTLISAISVAQAEGKDTTAAESYLATLKNSNLSNLEEVRVQMVNHILTLQQEPTIPETVKPGDAALLFTPPDSFVDCGKNPVLNPSSQLTIEAWIRPAVAQELNGINAGVMCKAGPSGWSWQLRYDNENGVPTGLMGFQFNSPEGAKWVMVDRNLLPGQKYYIVARFGGGNVECLLGDSQEFVLTDVEPMSAINPSDAALFISQDGWGNIFQGVVDEVRISSIYRSDDELYGNWNGGQGRRLSNDQHTIALYHMDEGNGDIIYDESPNGNDGMIYNATWVKGLISPEVITAGGGLVVLAASTLLLLIVTVGIIKGREQT